MKLLQKFRQPKRLDPKNRKDRDLLIEQAVKRTVKEYGKALEKLSAE